MLAAVAELAAGAAASGAGLCRLCRVRFRLSGFGDSSVKPALVASVATASNADGFVLRGGMGAADNNSTVTRSLMHILEEYNQSIKNG